MYLKKSTKIRSPQQRMNTLQPPVLSRGDTVNAADNQRDS